MSQLVAPRHLTVQVPGKIMLAGEYAVLRGGRALATTVARYMQIEAASDMTLQAGEPVRSLALTNESLTEIGGQAAANLGTSAQSRAGFLIASDLWQTPYFMPANTDIAAFAHEPLLEAVHVAMQRFKLFSGRVEIESDLDVSFGLGSSSAVRLGVLMALRRLSVDCYERDEGEWHGHYSRPDADWEAAVTAFKLQRAAQKNASGYDVATQLHGGLIFFTPPSPGADPRWPLGIAAGTSIQQQNLKELVHVFVGGTGAPTGIVVSDTIQWLETEGRWPMLQDLSADLVAAFDQALEYGIDDDAACQKLFASAGRARQAFYGSPHFPAALCEALQALPGCDQTWSFKTTGAGGEDALLILGSGSELAQAQNLLAQKGWHPLAAAFEQHGTRVQWHA